jgi:hypothetical protein
MAHASILSRRSALALGAGLLASPSPVVAKQAHPVLVELFTSQGCSSCPPADKLAGVLAAENQHVVSFNVDYWDYLGWRDTLAKPEYSQRQYDYARARGDGRVYTPQMVINGQAHVVGSHASSVHAAIDEAAKAAPVVKVDLSLSKKEIAVSLSPAAVEGDATLWLMAVEREVKQSIAKGENAGEAITYHNVVRNLVPATMWKGEAYSASWMRDAVMLPGCTACLAVVQSGKAGPVLGMAWV